MKKLMLTVVSIFLIVALCACSVTPDDGGEVETGNDFYNSDVKVEENTDADEAEKSFDTVVSDGDEEPTYVTDTTAKTTVTLNGSTATISGDGATFDEATQVLTLSVAEKVYEISGSLDDGRILAVISGEAQIVLNGVSVSCTTCAPFAIFGDSAKTVVLAENSENTFTDSSTYSVFYSKKGKVVEAEADNKLNACFYSQKDLVIEGSGSLTVNANYNNGIGCKGILTINDGKITVNCTANNAIKGDEFLIVKGGSFNVTSTADAIKTDDEFDADDLAATPTLGSILWENATATIVSGEDGISAFCTLLIKSGTFNITTNGGSKTKILSTDDTSYKGIKSDSELVISGGTFTLNCCDDALHSNGTLVVSDATITINTGDDGMHADGALTVYSGTIVIESCYEGIEGQQIALAGGKIDITSSDDGINAASDTASKSDIWMLFSGSIVYVNAQGDGIDSNGGICINDGYLFVDGPTSNGDAALDSETGITVNGGVVFAIGSTGMAETPNTSSTQCCFATTISSVSANDLITIKDSDGNEIVKYSSKKAFSTAAITVSSPKLAVGSTYSICKNNTQVATITQSSTLTSTIQGGGFPGGGGWNPGGGFPGMR